MSSLRLAPVPQMKILILVHTMVDGDAITNDVLGQKKALESINMQVFILTECPYLPGTYLDEELIDVLLEDENTLLIYHHSVFWKKGQDLFVRARGRKIIKYHNITPEHFFAPYSPDYFRNCLLGRLQTRDLIASGANIILCDSAFNKEDLRRYGAEEGMMQVLPPFNRLENFDSIEASLEVLEKYKDGKKNVLFVGRFAPNKGHLDALKVAYYYRLYYGDEIRFIFVGGEDGKLSRYHKEVRRLSRFLGLKNCVEFAGKVSFADLKAFYKAADVFLLLSQHEGFCVPILEAQYLGVPIVAYGGSAVPETLGQNQLVYKEMDHELISSSINELLFDKASRSYVVANGKQNVMKYQYNRLQSQFLGLLDGMIS